MATDTGTPIELGRAVQRARAELGLTQAEAAKKAGVSRRWLIELERGHGNAQLGKVLAALHALGLSLRVVRHEPPSGPSELDDIVEGTLR